MFCLEAAEDLSAATFDGALATIDRYSYPWRAAVAWLYGIAPNVVKKTRRSNVRQRAMGLMEGSVHRGNGRQRSDVLPLTQADGTEGLVPPMGLEHALLRRGVRAGRFAGAAVSGARVD